MPLRSVGALLAGSAFLFASALPAGAIEPETVANAIGAALVKGGKAQFGYDAAILDGDNVVIKGFALSRAASEESIRFEEAIVESPTEDEVGLFRSPRVTFVKGTAVGEPSGSIASATAIDVTVLDSAEVEGEGFAEGVIYRSVEMTDVHLSRDTTPREVAIQHVSVELGSELDDDRREISGTAEGLAISPEMFARGRFAPEKLGYDSLVFDIAWDGTLDAAAGTLAIESSTVSLRDGGTLSIAGTVGDLPDPRVLNDPDVVARVLQVELHDLVVRYEDGSFLGRLLDFLAGEQELSRTEYVEQLSAALPFLLAVLTHPGFRQQLIDALNVFLQDPQSLTLKIAPDPPISAKEVRSMARSSLGEVPDRLNASVSANSPQ